MGQDDGGGRVCAMSTTIVTGPVSYHMSHSKSQVLLLFEDIDWRWTMDIEKSNCLVYKI